MNKYNLKMELAPGTIPAMLMERVPNGADVLEFGCAYGRMTRYMKEEKGCRVCIVELEPEAYAHAASYAIGGWCGDAEQEGWLDAFAGQKFDCILFADVLEHLRDPGGLLERVTGLLKEDGIILVSIPNLAHFDILAGLAQNHFRYTDLGLLDNTHIHFWGYHDLEPFFDQVGLTMTGLDAVYQAPCQTEQKLNPAAIPPLLYEALNQIPLHDVYQYFIVLQKREWVIQSGVKLENRLRMHGGSEPAHFFWDFGNGYSVEQSTTLWAELDETGAGFSFCVAVPLGCRHVRFDPLEDCFCIVDGLTAVSDRGVCAISPLNGSQIDSALVFATTDPQIELEVPDGAATIALTGSLHPVFGESWRELLCALSDGQVEQARLLSEQGRASSEIVRLKEGIDKYQAQAEKMVDMIGELSGNLSTQQAVLTVQEERNRVLEVSLAARTEEKATLEASLAARTEEKATLEASLAARTEEKAALEADLSAQEEEKAVLEGILSAQTKEKAVLGRALDARAEELRALSLQLSQSYDRVQLLEAQYAAISDSQCWRMTAPLRKVLDAVKRMYWGALLHKGLRYWRANGLRATMWKVMDYKKRNATTAVTIAFDSVFESFGALSEALQTSDGCKLYLPEELQGYDQAPNKRALVLSHELNLTGGPVAALHLATSLRDRGYLPVIISPHDGALAQELEQQGIPGIVCPWLFTSEVIRQFAGLFDVIFANTIVSAPAVTALYGFSQPVIWWIHEARVSYTPAMVDALPKHLPAQVFVYAGGTYAKARLLEYRPQWEVDELLYYVPDLPQTMDSLSLPPQAEGKMVFACVGMLEERKGQDLLVSAIEHLPEALVLKGYYVFVGRQCHGPNYQCIMKLAQRYPDNVQYIAELPMAEVRRLYRRMDCLVCASRDDPMPIVVTEALAASKLVICSEHTGSAAILRADVSGLVYGDDDPIQLAACMAQVLEHNGDLDALRAAARKSYEAHFSNFVFDTNVGQVLRRVMKDRDPALSSLSMASLLQEFYAGAQSGDWVCLAGQILAYDAETEQRRVLLISHELSLTGAPIVLQYFAESLRSAGAQVLFAAPGDGPLRKQLEQKKIPVLVYTKLYYDDFLTRHAEAFDLIVANTVVAFQCVERLRYAQTPVLWWIHDSLASYEVGGFADIMPKTLPENVKIVCAGEYARTQLLKFYPQYTAEVLFYFTPDEVAAEIPHYEMHRDSKKFAFAVIGQQDVRKGHDIFAAAIELLTEDERTRSQFYFIGQYHDPIIQKIVDGICGKYPENVFLLPQVDHTLMTAVYHQCPCIVCASRDDPLPVFIAEAMMMSNIIICSEHTGSAPILERAAAGIVYHADDPAELAAQMRAVLAAPEDYAPMRNRARKAYETYFSQDAFDSNAQGLMNALISPRPDDEFRGTVSVVIPAYNAGPTIEVLLRNLCAQKGVRKIEIIVIDSGSTDNTPMLCREHGAVVVDISQSEFSHSHARNLGAKSASGDILLFMTQDALPQDEHWMHTLIAPLVSGEAVAVSCREQCPEGTDLYYQIAAWNHAGFLGIREGDRISRMDRSDTLDILRQKAALNDVTTAVDATVFSNFLYRFSYAEDLDLGLRLLKSGLAIKGISSTCSIHGHDRNPGYYLKRAYVEGKSLGIIQPGWGAPGVTQSVAARTAIHSAGLLSCALEDVAAYGFTPCETDAFIARLQSTLSQYAHSAHITHTAQYLSGRDELLEWCLETLVPYGGTACPGEADIFHAVCHYLETVVRKYLSTNLITGLDSAMQQSLCDCLFKQLCLSIGGMLAGIPATEPLYEALQILSKGV